jgi:ubiquinone/menaquinone biosynthesis C-methylase UbiE
MSSQWEKFGAVEPYFAVLTDDRFRRQNLSAEVLDYFYDLGKADVERLLAVVKRQLDPSFSPEKALDFGCGVGRLTLALAKRVPYVVGVDVAESMLQIARERAKAEGLSNISFLYDAGTASSLPALDFDFVCSLLVLQHVPPRQGTQILKGLLGLTAPGGVCVFQVIFSREGRWLRKIGRFVRSRVPLVHRIAAKADGAPVNLPYMQMNVYELDSVYRLLRENGFPAAWAEFTHAGGMSSATVFCRKEPS